MVIDQKEIKRQLSYIESQMYKPNLTEIEKDKLTRMGRFLVRNSSPDDNRANIVLARLYYQIGNYLASRIQYNYAKNINPNKPTIYYGLYKNYVMEGKWQDALENLQTYITMIQDQKRLDGFNIVIALLNNLIDQGITTEIPLDIFLSQNITDEKLANMYEELVENITEGFYLKAITLANECEKYSRSVGNYMEFLTLAKILREVLEKQRYYCKNNIRADVNRALACKDYNELYKIIAIDVYNKYSVINASQYLPTLIENGYHSEAKDLLNAIELNQQKRKVKAIYRKFIHEKELIDNYTEEQQEYYYQSIETIENALMEDDYVDVFDMASAAFYKLEHPIFLYYMGLSMFFLEEYTEAMGYFVGYNRRGGTKALESRYFIACCHKNLDQRKQFKSRRQNYKRYCHLLDKIYLKSFMPYSYEPVEEEPPKKHGEFDLVIENADYLEISNLLKHGQFKDANKKIAELERKSDKTSEDKKVLEYIRTNKKILSNQNK